MSSNGNRGQETLEVMARITDNPIKIKKVVEKWLLLTYDLPHTPTGDRARALFLNRASAIGATRHTDSVYLMPWSPEAERMALELARTEGADVIVWAQATPLDREEEITRNYDHSLRPKLDEISERLDRMNFYIRKSQPKRAAILTEKTERLLQEAEVAINRRDSDTLQLRLETLKARFAQVAI